MKKRKKRYNINRNVSDPYKRLAEAIILQAIYDIIYYDTSKAKCKNYNVSLQDRKDAEIFLRTSDFPEWAMEVDGNMICDMIAKGIADGTIINTNNVRKLMN